MSKPGLSYEEYLERYGSLTYSQVGGSMLPLLREGRDLFVNFSTSAYGHMWFKLTDLDGNSITSSETFGDSTDRRVRFDGEVGSFAGKPVVLSVNMFDADLYAIMFRM